MKRGSGDRETEGFSLLSGSRGSFFVLDSARGAGGIMAFSAKVLDGGKEAEAGSSDSIESVSELLPIDPDRVVTVNQVHGDGIEVVESVPRSKPTADAIIALRPGIFPAVRTADCLPVLLLDPEERICAAVHAGWRGTVLGIAGKVVGTLSTEFGIDPRRIVVSLGPAIGPCCYEVGEDVVDRFTAAFPSYSSAIELPRPDSRAETLHGTPIRVPGIDPIVPQPLRPSRPPHQSYRLDLARANVMQLRAHGVQLENIHHVGLCTACLPGLLHSYRRDGAGAGRQISLTGIT